MCGLVVRMCLGPALTGCDNRVANRHKVGSLNSLKYMPLGIPAIEEAMTCTIRVTRYTRRVLLGFVGAALCMQPWSAVAASNPTDAQAAARMVAVARLWGAIEYFDPDVAGNPDADWDRAFAQNLGAIEAAGSTAEYAAAVGQMLAALHDPATRIVGASAATSAPGGPEYTLQTQNGVAILRLGDPAAFASNSVGADATVDRFVGDAATAKGVVIDLRVSRQLTPDEAGGIDNTLQPTYDRMPLVYGTIFTPSTRTITYRGLPSTINPGFYGMIVGDETGSPVLGTAKHPIRVSIVVNENSEIPPLVLALIDAGECHVVVDGRAPNLAASSTMIPLTEGVSAAVRSADYAKTLDLSSPAMIVLRAGSAPDVATQSAIAATDRPIGTGKSALSPVTPASSSAAAPSYGAAFPEAPYRALAAVEAYNVIRYFSPYTELMHDDWDAALAQAIPEVQQAATPRDYYLAISKFYAHLHDSHGVIGGWEYIKYFLATPPVSIRYLHGEAVITDFVDRSEASTAGAQIGDVILAIDGEPTQSAIRRWQAYVNASTPQASLSHALQMATSGQNGTTVSLLVRAPSDTTKTLTLTRRWRFHVPAQSTSQVYRILAGNVGYVDLTRLTVDQVDPMFVALAGTRAIVFDDRGYPNETAWSIAPRLTARERVKISLYEMPLVRNMASQDASDEFLPTMISSYDLIPSIPGKSKYLHPTVLLINEQTISQAEYTGMMFRAADDMQFVGTPTVGADGDVTSFMVPGRLQLMFSGASVRWPDGRQTQRIGLQPDVRVEPTAQDIARGKDVVLLTGLRVALRKAGAPASVVSRSVAEEQGAEATAFFRAFAQR